MNSPEIEFVEFGPHLDWDEIISGSWRIFDYRGYLLSDHLSFLPDGTISGHNNSDQSKWVMSDGNLCFCDADGSITTTLFHDEDDSIRYTLKGLYKNNPNIVVRIERRGMFHKVPDSIRNLQIVNISDSARISDLGFSGRAIHEFFYGNVMDKRPDPIMMGGPDGIMHYIMEEFDSSSWPYFLLNSYMSHFDIWGVGTAACTRVLTRTDKGDLPFDVLPLFYKFENEAGRIFWAISIDITGKINQIYVPDMNVMLNSMWYGDRGYFSAVVRELEIATQNLVNFSPNKIRPVVIVDMMNNFAHQAINHLSGLERLNELVAHTKFQEIWVSGVEFFGRTVDLFPEFSGKIRYFDSCWEMAKNIVENERFPVRVGSCYVSNKINTRIVKQAELKKSPNLTINKARSPVIAFTVRGGGRRCLNLPEVVGEVVRFLLPRYRNLGVVIDGFVLPDPMVQGETSALVLWRNDWYRRVVEEEFKIARAIELRVPKGVICLNLIGSGLSESIAALQNVTAYVAHVGTLQHKIAFFVKCGGVVHGPSDQLKNLEAGPYYCESGVAPKFLDPAAVADIPGDYDRGNRSADYEIIDVDALIRELLIVLRQSET